MPVLDGYQTTQALRQLEGTERHTVVIGLTANTMKGDREKCLADISCVPSPLGQEHNKRYRSWDG